MAIRYTFKAYERLKREQHIDTLFHTGKAFSVFPVKLIYHMLPRGAELSPVRVGFSVPKKKFRKAVERNRVKRLLREAWRLNKHKLYEAVPPECHLHIFLIFTDSTLPDIQIANATVIKGIEKLAEKLASGIPVPKEPQ